MQTEKRDKIVQSIVLERLYAHFSSLEDKAMTVQYNRSQIRLGGRRIKVRVITTRTPGWSNIDAKDITVDCDDVDWFFAAYDPKDPKHLHLYRCPGKTLREVYEGSETIDVGKQSGTKINYQRYTVVVVAGDCQCCNQDGLNFKRKGESDWIFRPTGEYFCWELTPDQQQRIASAASKKSKSV